MVKPFSFFARDGAEHPRKRKLPYEKVVLVGASGNIGKPLVKALLTSTEPRFQVTVLTRLTSKYIQPADVPRSSLRNLSIVHTNFNNHASLVKALTGQQALILTLSSSLDTLSKQLIDAAIEAGVKWVMPSNFGNDDTPLLNSLFASKRIVYKYLKEKASKGLIKYSVLRTGPIFELAMKDGLGFDFAEQTATLYQGNRKANITTLRSVCTAIISILRDPQNQKFINKTLHIHDFYVTQLELMALAEIVSGERWTVSVVDVEEEGRKAMEALKNGRMTRTNLLAVMNQSVWGIDTSARWDPKDDSARLGLGVPPSLGGVSLVDEIQKMDDTAWKVWEYQARSVPPSSPEPKPRLERSLSLS